MINGSMYGFFAALWAFDYTCHFAVSCDYICWFGQGIFGSIYHCFSRNKAYSHKGYSMWLFVIMYMFAILLYLG